MQGQLGETVELSGRHGMYHPATHPNEFGRTARETAGGCWCISAPQTPPRPQCAQCAQQNTVRCHVHLGQTRWLGCTVQTTSSTRCRMTMGCDMAAFLRPLGSLFHSLVVPLVAGAHPLAQPQARCAHDVAWPLVGSAWWLWPARGA